MQRMGDLPGARPWFEKALAQAREIGNKQAEASNFIHLADLAFEQGDLPGATNALTAADVCLQGTGDKRHHLYALYSWGDVLSAKDDLAGARSKDQEALDTSKEIGAKDLVGYSQVMLASLATEEGRPSEGTDLAGKAVEEFRVEKSPDFEIRADIALSAAMGKPAEALAPLRSSVAEWHRRGSVLGEFEARLALAEAELKAGSQRLGRTRLQQLQKDARAKGFLLITRKVEAALKAEASLNDHSHHS
jgi:ATP/maltotriose-dependent transcriptional regulator MalT